MSRAAPVNDAEATGELNLELQASQPFLFSGGRQSGWGDRKSWVLEERLPISFATERGGRPGCDLPMTARR